MPANNKTDLASATDTAHVAWDHRWGSEEGREEWLTPEKDVIEAVELALSRGGRTALDLGCGVGRHALAIASHGLDTCAIDASQTGLDHLARQAAAANLHIRLDNGKMTQLPYSDGQFDLVVAFNVIYHGDETIVRQSIEEIRRVLNPNGIYQGTMLSKRNANYGAGREIAPNTFVQEVDDGDKSHPHFFCNARELVTLFEGFELLSARDQEHGKPGSSHWHMLAEKTSIA